MSNEQRKYYCRYQSSERYFQTSSSGQPLGRNGMCLGSQAFQNRLQGNGYYQRRQVYAHGSVNPLMQEYETDPVKLKEEKLRHRFSSLRRWEYTKLGKEFQQRKIRQPSHSLKFTVLSYNVLAQHLLEEHTYLYRKAEPEALDWEKRSERILREVKDTKADILCLQEVQSDHFSNFYVPRLQSMGFKGIFKKRTGDKPDGCAIFFRNSQFVLKDSINVEYCKPNVELLDRDNIGLVALLTPRIRLQSKNAENKELPFIVVATTHLLYNPRRHDIKLAQLQLLFAELDLIAFKNPNSANDNSLSQSYHPTILTGDFNLTPDTSIYQFITQGSLQYKGLSRRQLTSDSRGHVLNNELIPPHLKVTDACQHLHATEKRTSLLTSPLTKTEGLNAEPPRFSTGQLSHQLQLQSVYPHRLNRLNGVPEATTFQNEWVTVDYIFHKYFLSKQQKKINDIHEHTFLIFSGSVDQKRSHLKLLSRLGLLAGKELDALEGLPSLASPSDHLPLVARFLWTYEEV